MLDEITQQNAFKYLAIFQHSSVADYSRVPNNSQ